MKDEFVVLVEQLGEDFKYLSAVPEEYSEYAISIADKLRMLIRNLKYVAKYQLFMDTDEEIDTYVRDKIQYSFVQSEKAKEFNKAKGLNVQSQ